jgi:predicted TIM-barrel fold metal-dependent hydrolase
MTIDLAHAPIVDVHCHPWRIADVLAMPAESFEDRLAMVGMCQLTSGSTEDLSRELEFMSSETPLVLAARRHLSEHLGCLDDRDALAVARSKQLSTDPNAYLRALYDSVNIGALFCDDGYPQPSVNTESLSEDIDRPVHRVGRIEPWIKELALVAPTYQDLEDRFLERVQREADAGAIAFKTVIAYRTGLDVAEYSVAEAERAFHRWKSADLREARESSKPVRDRLLHQLANLCARIDRPMHLHCGGGDPDVRLTYARPTELFGFIAKHTKVPLVLIHGGWPWMEEAAYISSIFPHVFVDVSLMLPWASLGIDQKLEMILGTTPGGKVMYGSDEASEPEVLWLAAKYGRAAFERVLTRAVEHDWLTLNQAHRIGKSALGDNALRLHGIATS